MKTLLTSTLLLLFITMPSFSQKVVGVATYKTDRKVEIKLDSTSVASGMEEMIQAQLRKQFQKEFTLNFNSEESLYTEVEKLDAPSAPSGGFSIKVTGNSDILYRNIKDSKMVNQTEIMSKQFLIKDAVEKPDWTLTKEVKNIGNYTCFKAIWTRDVENQTFDSLTDKLVTKTESKTTTAWYTLDVPVQHGPSSFWGLPGLILEVEDGKLTVLCSKVVINPENVIVIEAPDKGKVVSKEEFDIIQEKKSAEMMEQFQTGNGRRSNGNVMSIKIGG